MQNPENNQFPRRAFLKRATAAVGATILTVGPVSSVASAMGRSPIVEGAPSMGYWNGTSFVAASDLPFGDLGLTSVALTIQCFGPLGDLVTLDANALVPVGKSVIQKAPFQAWVAGPSGSKEVRFVMTTDTVQGLSLTAHTRVHKGSVQPVELRLIHGTEEGMKLREGIYVLTAATMNWNSYTYDAENLDAPLTGPAGPVTSLQYLVLTVSHT